MSDNVEEKITSLAKRVDDVEEVIGGSLKGEPGLMQLTKQLVKDVYNEQHGALVRLSSIESENTRIRGAAWGAGWVFKVFWAVFGGIVVLAIGKLLKL